MTDFFLSDGRVAPVRWAVWFAAAVAGLIIWYLIVQRATGAAYVLAWTAIGPILAKLAVESIRRLHDRGRHGVWLLPIAGVVAALVLGAVVRRMSHGPEPVGWLLSAIAVVGPAAIFLGPGTAAANSHGPRPTGMAATVAQCGRRGLILATAIMVACTATGFAGASWLDSAERRRIEQWRYGEKVSRDLDRADRTGRERRSGAPATPGDKEVAERLDALLGNEGGE